MIVAVNQKMVVCARRTWMGQGDRSRTNRPKEAAVSDEVKVDRQELDRPKRRALLEFWEIMWRTKRVIIVFSSAQEATDAGLPTLATMSELARRVTGCTIVHYGFGVFGAKSCRGDEIFSFCGGGAMQQAKEIDCSYTILQTNDKKHRRLILKILREIAPGGFAEAADRAAQRKAERDQEAEESEESEMIVAGIDREIYEAALEVLKDMDTIGASEEASVIRLQKAVDAVKGFKS